MWGLPGTTGQYSFFNSTVCPSGWVAANGTNGTLDLRGEFIRGWDNGRAVDPGRALASWQSDELRAHQHELDSKLIMLNGAAWGPADIPKAAGGGGYGLTAPSGGSETRPRNVALLVCMKS